MATTKSAAVRLFHPYAPRIQVDNGSYFPEPYSIAPLPPVLRRGLAIVGSFALLSLLSSTTLILFILHRFVTWRSHYRTFIGYNQYVVLVLNLLLADVQQSAGFSLSFHWLHRNAILAPTSGCFAQGWLIHSGDVASGFFVLAIALHTFYTAVYGRRIGTTSFAVVVVCIWLFAYMLTAIGVGIHKDTYFVRAGAWCWVSPAYEHDRLFFHYMWIFMIEFATIVIYVITFYTLRRKTRQLFNEQRRGNGAAPNRQTVAAVNRITGLMTLYPCVYLLMTLPLSSGRMWSMAHGGASTSFEFACIAGSLLTSCGWVDSLLYTLTRKRLLKDTMPGGNTSGSRRIGDGSAAWEATELGDKGITHTRTVTVEGGQIMDYTPEPDRRHRLGLSDPRGGDSQHRPPSPTGSIDPILSGQRRAGHTKTEVSVGLQEISGEESGSDDLAALPPYMTKGPRRP